MKDSVSCRMYINKDDAEFEYAEFSCLATNNMYNVTNYYIRNLMTGLKKSEKERTENEKDVIKLIQESIPTINKKLEEKYNLKISNIRSNKKLSEKEKAEKIKKVKHSVFEMPTKEKWFAGYNLLDAVFKFNENTDYHSHHSHLIQNAITSCVSAWKSFFEQPDDKKKSQVIKRVVEKLQLYSVILHVRLNMDNYNFLM